MVYADFLGFLFSQMQLQCRAGGLVIDPDIQLGVCHATTVPPYMKKLQDIKVAHAWFVRMMDGIENSPEMHYGLQHPPKDAQLSDLQELRRQGVELMTLAYEGASVYGGGFATPERTVTKKGYKLIRDMSQAGMILDLSHSGFATASEALSFISRQNIDIRVVVTHTGCAAVNDHPRNCEDDVLKGIRDAGGLVGLVTVTWLLHPTDNSMDPIREHLDHLLEVVGEDQICLGTDGIYKSLSRSSEESRFAFMKEAIDLDGNFNPRLPEHPLELNCPHRMQVLEEYLLDYFSPLVVKKVMGENLIKFFSQSKRE